MSSQQPQSVTMYGTPYSLYSGKLRAYLRKKGLNFKEIPVTIALYKSFIVPRTGVRYIPVLQTDDDQVWQDTTVIIDELERRHPMHSAYPATAKQKLVSLLLEVYADEWLVIPAMHYRWNFKAQNEKFIYGEFGQTVMPQAPKFVQRLVGKKVAKKFRGFVPLLGITQHTKDAIERSYRQLLIDLNLHFNAYDYVLGSKPSIADFALMGPLYAHLYRDPAPGALMRELAPAVAQWVERMNSEEPTLQYHDWLADDQIPTTLLAVLRRMASEQLPVLQQTDALLTQWRAQNPHTEKIPRSIGTHTFNIEGTTGQRIVIPYSLWMLQRPIDFYQNQNDKSQLDQLLSEIGFGDALQKGLNNRLTRVDNLLVFADGAG